MVQFRNTSKHLLEVVRFGDGVRSGFVVVVVVFACLLVLRPMTSRSWLESTDFLSDGI